MRTAKYKRRIGAGFTLVELLVVLAVMAVLAALLFPTFSQAREKSREARCLSNLRQLSQAMLIYVQDYDEMLPRDVTRYGDLPAKNPCSTWQPGRRIEAKLEEYVRSAAVFDCPSADTPLVKWNEEHSICARNGWGYPEFLCVEGDASRGKPLSYGWNAGVFAEQVDTLGSGCNAPTISLAAVEDSDYKVMVADSRYPAAWVLGLAFANYPGEELFFASNVREYWPQFSRHEAYGPEIVPGRDTRHHMGQNVAFFDGRARWVRYQEFTGPSYEMTVSKWFDHR